MKHKGLFFMVVLLIGFSAALFGQDTTSPPADIKEFWELQKWTVILGGLLALMGLLKNTGLDQKLEKNWFGRLLLSTIHLALTFVGKKYKVYRLKRKELKAARASGVAKVLLIGLFLSGVSIAASAQDGFFKKMIDPVTPERIELKQQQTFKGEDPVIETDASAWFFRGAAVISGVKFHHSTEEGKFITSEFVRAGAGVEFAHYGVLDGVAFNDYGVGAYFMPPITTDPAQQYASIMVAGTIYDLGYRFKLDFLNGISLGLGLCYDINKAVPAGDNFSFVPNFSVTF